MSKNVFIVIPTVRDLSFLEEWENEFKNCFGIIVEDHKKKEVKTPHKFFRRVYHYCWQDIDKELGKNSWIIPRKNSGIRCFGFLKAYQMKARIIITLDDDCYPIENNFVNQHLENLSQKAPHRWFATFPHPQYNFTRGFPYKIRKKYPVVISHGLWSGALDLDARTEKKHGRPKLEAYNLPLRQFAPFGYYFPMCVMNLAFRTEITPLMYMFLMGEDEKGNKWGYDRFDDIWAGVVVKKILDHLGLGVIVGSPLVEHRKKSDIEQSLIKEKEGLKMNEVFWQIIDRVKLKSITIKGAYQELINKAEFPNTKYFQRLKEAMEIWGKSF